MLCPENEYQFSMTDEFCKDSWACKVVGRRVTVHKHWHYRLVMGTVGYSLKTLRGTDELLHATFDVFHGKCNQPVT